jgi:hypothetical protein
MYEGNVVGSLDIDGMYEGDAVGSLEILGDRLGTVVEGRALMLGFPDGVSECEGCMLLDGVCEGPKLIVGVCVGPSRFLRSEELCCCLVASSSYTQRMEQ